MMGKSQEAKGQGAKGEGSCCASRTAPSASLLAALLLSLVSIAACVYLGLKTSDLQARVLAIETAQGGLSAAAATAASYPQLPSYSLDHLNSLMQEKVERLLAQFLKCFTKILLNIETIPHGGLNKESMEVQTCGYKVWIQVSVESQD
ncbi:hypothetical protein lerEdw1_012301 [Lerista edwardsae]|nr:hypothetical protein lerEdw1_012301 [Lerista edwardsae]